MTKVAKFKDQIVSMYNSGINCPEIANALKLNKSTISRYLRRLGIVLRPKYITSRKYEIDYTFFDKIDTKEKAYFLGFLYSDGCNMEDGTIKITLKSTDKDILNILSNFIYKNKDRKLGTYISKSGYQPGSSFSTLTIKSRYMSDILYKRGLVYRKSLTLKFPDIDDALLSHFLRGYFDGDGWVSVTKRNDCKTKRIRAGFLCSNLFADTLIKKINKLGIDPSKITDHRCDSIYDVRVSGNKDVITLLEFLYLDSINLRLTRKHDIYQTYLKSI